MKSIPIPFDLLDEKFVLRFAGRIDSSCGPDACWPSTLAPGSNGYGQIKVGGRHYLTHRIAFALASSIDPGDLTVSHECHDIAAAAGECDVWPCPHQLCNNPAHLSLKTVGDNLSASANTVNSINAATTHCPAGHELAEGNLVRSGLASGRRKCLRCDHAHSLETAAAVRAAHIRLGITQTAYRAAYGQSVYTALAVAAGITDPLTARAEGERLKASA